MNSLARDKGYKKLLSDIESLYANAWSVLVTMFGEGFSRANVYNFRRFFLTHRIFQPAGILGWSHYVELLSVKDDKVRAKLEREVHKKNLSKREVKVLVKERLSEIKAKSVESRVVEIETEFLVQLPCSREGEFGEYKAVSKDRVAYPTGCVMVDCGFNVWQTVPLAECTVAEKPSYLYVATVQSVIDADTLWVTIDLGWGTRIRQKLRLNGIDAPELSTPEGEKARRFVVREIKTGTKIVIRTRKSDKYDRYLADVFYLAGARSPKRTVKEGVFLNQELLDKGFATPF